MLPVKRTNGHGLIPEFFNDFFEGNLMNRIGSGSPAMNVFEDEKEYKLEIAAPGMCKKDVDIHITKDNKIVIELEKKCEGGECEKDKKEKKDKKDKKILRREFSYIKSRQTLSLPDNADRDKIEACVKHGVLHITIPKLQNEKIAAETKVIEVK